jgi:1,4-alpha-glucan branching enzyme
MFSMSGKKLLFMGCEFGQKQEWRHDGQLDWHLLDDPGHAGVLKCVGDLNRLYRNEPALHEMDCEPGGFTWINANDAEASVYSFYRSPMQGRERVVCVLNFTPTPRSDFRLGVPGPGYWKEILNTDAEVYGGANFGNNGGLQAEAVPNHGQPYSVMMTIPPLAAVFLKGEVLPTTVERVAPRPLASVKS